MIELLKFFIVAVPWLSQRQSSGDRNTVRLALQLATGRAGAALLPVTASSLTMRCAFRCAEEPWTVATYAVLALMYMGINNISFYAMDVTDPATFHLFRSVTPFFTAVVLHLAYFMDISPTQWACILQAVRRPGPCSPTGGFRLRHPDLWLDRRSRHRVRVEFHHCRHTRVHAWERHRHAQCLLGEWRGGAWERGV